MKLGLLRKTTNYTTRSLLLLTSVVAGVVFLVNAWKDSVFSESAFVEFQNLGFELVEGEGCASLIYVSPDCLTIDPTMVPHATSLRGIATIVTGNSTLSPKLVELIENQGIIVLNKLEKRSN